MSVVSSTDDPLGSAFSGLPHPLRALVRFATGMMGAVAYVLKSMTDGGLPADEMNRCLVSLMAQALERPEIGDGTCLRCAGSGEAAIGMDTTRCGACDGSGRMLAV